MLTAANSPLLVHQISAQLGLDVAFAGSRTKDGRGSGTAGCGSAAPRRMVGESRRNSPPHCDRVERKGLQPRSTSSAQRCRRRDCMRGPEGPRRRATSEWGQGLTRLAKPSGCLRAKALPGPTRSCQCCNFMQRIG
jgi:hypothetical protein